MKQLCIALMALSGSVYAMDLTVPQQSKEVRIKLLKGKQQCIKDFRKLGGELPTLQEIKWFLEKSKAYFEDPLELINYRLYAGDETFLHIILQSPSRSKTWLNKVRDKIVIYLLELGASVDMENLAGLTVRDILEQTRYKAFQDKLHELRGDKEGPREKSPMAKACYADPKNCDKVFRAYKDPIEQELKELTR